MFLLWDSIHQNVSNGVFGTSLLEYSPRGGTLAELNIVIFWSAATGGDVTSTCYVNKKVFRSCPYFIVFLKQKHYKCNFAFGTVSVGVTESVIYCLKKNVYHPFTLTFCMENQLRNGSLLKIIKSIPIGMH